MNPTGDPRLPDVTAKDLSSVRRLAGHLKDAGDLDSLGRILLHGAGSILPADFMVWNLWTLPMDAMVSCQANDTEYCRELQRRDEALSATIVHHPVIAAGDLESCLHRPRRMSDYQSDIAFRSTPLFSEVYRHLDSRYQIAFIASRLESLQVVLSWNMNGRDFTGREMQLLHLMGMQVGTVSRQLEEQRALESMWGDLCQGLSGIGGPENPLTDSPPVLGTTDGRILSELIRGGTRAGIAEKLGWRRDTLDRHLGGFRERLGYENVPQMMRDFSSLAAHRRSSAADGGPDRFA